MGRKLTFHKEAALENIMHLFWRKGYEATSMRDIAGALDVPMASVYHSFGDKKSVFVATIDAYFDTHIKPNFEALQERDNSKQALLDLFHSFADQCSESKLPQGCFLVQSAEELAEADGELAEKANEKLEFIRNQFKMLVQKARQNKQLVTKETSDALATYLFATMLAVKTWARTGVDSATIKQYLRIALKPLSE